MCARSHKHTAAEPARPALRHSRAAAQLRWSAAAPSCKLQLSPWHCPVKLDRIRGAITSVRACSAEDELMPLVQPAAGVQALQAAVPRWQPGATFAEFAQATTASIYQ